MYNLMEIKIYRRRDWFYKSTMLWGGGGGKGFFFTYPRANPEYFSWGGGWSDGYGIFFGGGRGWGVLEAYFE